MFTLCRVILIASIALCGCCLWLGGAAFGGGLAYPMILGGIVYVAKRRRNILTAYGTASWAGEDDLDRAGMSRGSGLIIGRLVGILRPSLLAATLGLLNPLAKSSRACNRFLRAMFPKKEINPPLVRLSRAVHTALFAPTGVGKGVSCAIPFLLECPDSCVVLDFKGELAKATMKRRRRMGHRIVLVDPFKMVTDKPDTFNPLDFISKDSLHAIDDVRDLAESQVIRTNREKEPHWLDSAEAWISAVIAAAVVYGDADDRSLQSARELLASAKKTELLVRLLCESDAWDGMLARLGEQLTHYKDKELGSTLTTANRFLRYLDTPAVAASTKSSSFDPADLLKGKMTIYLVLPPNHARVLAPLLRMWIGSMLRAVVRGGLQERRKVHFLLDEAAGLGQLPALDDAVDKYRGYGVRLIFIYQSLGQLKKCFPDGQEQTLLSNVTQVFFGVNDLQTAEYVSNRLGEETIIVNSGGTSTGTSEQWGGQRSSGSSRNTNDNWQQLGRKLLKPEEVMALPPRTAITFSPGLPPICTRLIRYYEERPNSLWQYLKQGLRANFYAVRLFVGAVLVTGVLFNGFQSRLSRPHVRPVQVRTEHKGEK